MPKSLTRPCALIGCAGWSIPKPVQGGFPTEGSHLERYAARFPAVEINSSFYRPHRRETYVRWATSVPPDFRFAVKVPKVITHERRLVQTDEPLRTFLDQVGGLGDRLGTLLVQLPPGLRLEPNVANEFFETLRRMYSGVVVCEPRHPTWFTAEGAELLTKWQVARVAADPAPVPEAAELGGWSGVVYHRLHGSPKMYYSSYPDKYLDALARKMGITLSANIPTWCIFDNTAAFAAMPNALWLLGHLSSANK